MNLSAMAVSTFFSPPDEKCSFCCVLPLFSLLYYLVREEYVRMQIKVLSRENFDETYLHPSVAVSVGKALKNAFKAHDVRCEDDALLLRISLIFLH